jgi:Fur family ferric uptake transcriptional regulator
MSGYERFISTRKSAVTFSGGLSMAASPSRRVSTGERLNTAETTGKLQQILAQRMTKQRRVILQVMDTAEQHLDVDQILARAQKIDSGVHLVTVYRTIDLLKKQGLIDELDLLHLRGDRHYYESHGPRDHIHVACLRCGKVREFESRLYEQLKEQIARDFDMKVTISRTEVGGYCGACLAADPSLAAPSKATPHSASADDREHTRSH